jgi:hypothetical protein
MTRTMQTGKMSRRARRPPSPLPAARPLGDLTSYASGRVLARPHPRHDGQSTILVRLEADGVDEARDAGLEDAAGMVIPQIVSCADMAE